MRKLLFSVALFFAGILIHAQIAPSKYFIEFSDKNGTPYSINNPQDFLSQRAIDRRNAQYIQITGEDLPVNPSYVTQVASTGVTVLNRSKWFNGIIIYTDDSTKLDLIAALPFVKSILKNSGRNESTEPFTDKFSLENSFLTTLQAGYKNFESGFDYGPSYHQIHMMNGDLLHNAGNRGQGKVIAILDAGFLKADTLHAFDSLWQNNQILGTRDFVNPGGNVFNEHIHGMCVLSVLAGDLPGQIIGTAPKASYWLLRSEDGDTEYIIEEYNWVCAAEFADSAGADIISSSLGYTRFKDISQDHTCADMNGSMTPVTRGANIASLKGMVVITSAGNDGDDLTWQCISAPADGDNVLAIGAVDSSGNYARFSSKGVVEGNRVKPNVSAMGKNAYVYWTDNTVVQRSGTSFSCPLVAGMAACLWQAMPEVTPARIYQSIEESSSHYSAPDSLTGYGIPDFSKALAILSMPEKQVLINNTFPNPFENAFTISLISERPGQAILEIYNLTGMSVYRNVNVNLRAGENRIEVKNLGYLISGIYLARVRGDSFSENFRLIKISGR
jgi:serine protease AprX